MTDMELSGPAALVERDRWGRPKIMQPDGSTLPYTRASTFAGYLDDAGGLVKWKARHVALGVGRHEDLAALAASCEYGDAKLDEVIETAIDRSGGSAKANWGTAVHAFTEPDASPYIPDRMLPDWIAYDRALTDAGITVVETECFVVEDALKVAGTFDHIYNVPGHGNVMVDKKTGTLHPSSVAIQLAAYAHGSFYDPDTGIRMPLPNVDLERALVVHIPAGEARCDLHWVDIRKGYDAALTAAWVRDYRSAKLLSPFEAALPDVDELMVRIDTAETVDQLSALWAAHQSKWTEQHTATAAARKKVLAA